MIIMQEVGYDVSRHMAGLNLSSSILVSHSINSVGFEGYTLTVCVLSVYRVCLPMETW